MPETKICKACGMTKAIAHFGVRKSSRDGRKALCRKCENAYQREHYRRNIEASRAVKAAHMAKARRDPKKREKILESQRKSYANRGHATQKERIARMQREQPFRWRAYLIRNLNPRITGDYLERLWSDQGGFCGLTGRPLVMEEADLDHIIPRSRGGETEIGNLRWVWSRANEAKGNMMDEEFLAFCRQVTEWIGRRLMEWRVRYVADDGQPRH